MSTDWRKFRKRPVVIEAYQTEAPLDIPTLEGVMHANPGDWIIRGVKGELYPCKPDIFEASYEPVEGEAILKHEISLTELRRKYA